LPTIGIFTDRTTLSVLQPIIQMNYEYKNTI